LRNTEKTAMKDIINWLRAIEHLASEVYALAADVYADDPILRKFLDQTGEDEAWHYHVMGSAADFLADKPVPTPAISVDQETSEKFFNCFYAIRDGLKNKTLSRDELIRKIVEVELSEWNEIFLYVVNVLKELTPEFKYPAARIQNHIKQIEYFLDSIEGKPELLKKIKELPSVWVENILIVDDEPLITNLLKALLNREGNIDIAHNGKEALDFINKKFYKLVISDIDMPIMDGLTLYRETVAQFPSSSKRFLFLTGYLSDDKLLFIKRNDVKFLEKPAEINTLREVASEIILLR
jgi:CheY-like chemotaxis protein